MAVLIFGLIAFLGLHLLRAVAEPWRVRQIAALGEMRWKALYSVVSIGSLALVIWGFSLARVDSPILWSSPMALHYVTALLVLVAFVLVAAAYIPGTRIKAAIGHPMTLGIKTWAFGHLLSAGSLADVVLFGSFLVWSVLVFAAARRRDRASGVQPPQGNLRRDALAVVVGVAVWVAFGGRGHEWLVGVRPFG
jgi:uncharacterized membrane protein